MENKYNDKKMKDMMLNNEDIYKNKIIKFTDIKGTTYKKEKKKSFFHNEQGVNTIEIVIILAVIVGIALIFRDKMISFAGNVIEDVLDTQTDISPETIRSEGSKGGKSK